MIRPELRSLESLYLDVPLKDYSPSDPGCVGILVDAYIGSAGEPGDDIFEFLVRTPRYLTDELAQKGPLFGRDYILLDHYDFQLVWNRIDALCKDIEGPDWETVARRLGRYGLWE